MPKWEIAIATYNEPEAHRKQEGDIISFNPAPWRWGKKELDQFLIVTVDGMTHDAMVELCFPFYEGGETDEDLISKNKIRTIAKRKYKLPLSTLKKGWVPTLDTEKVRDKTLVYQPLLTGKIVIDTSEKVSIFLNNFTKTYKYPIKKVA